MTSDGAPPIASDEHAIDEPPLDDASAGGIGFTLLVLAIAAVFFVQSLGIGSDAAIWPRNLSALLLVLSAIQLVRSVVGRWRRAPFAADLEARARLGARLFTAAWLVALCLAVPFTGFGVAALVFLPVYLVVSGVRSIAMIALVTVVTASLITVLFGYVAGVPIWSADI